MLRRIVALNREGLECIQERRYVSAILSLRHAVDCLKDLSMKVATENADSAARSEPARTFRLVHVPLSPVQEDELEKRSAHNIFKVYTSGFDYPLIK